MLHIDKQYTPEELRLEYATKARKLFEGMSDLDAIQGAIRAFEVDTLHY